MFIMFPGYSPGNIIFEGQMKTPVLFLVFNRPELTRVSFEAIRQARPERLYVSADGPRPDKSAEVELCRRTREIATAVDWPCEVKTLFRSRNQGCRIGCTSGISWFFKQEPEGIVLEGDCVPQPSFFPYCAELLKRYREVPEVMLIGGSNYQYGKRRGKASYYFSLYPHIWGWASWASTWRHYNINMEGLERFIKTRMPRLVGHDGAYRAMMRKFMLVQQGVDNNWDFQLVYSIWKQGGLCVIPNVNMVGNIGNVDESAHPWRPDVSHFRKVGDLMEITHPASIERNEEADRFHSDMLATEYGGQDAVLLREGFKRLEEGAPSAALELALACRAFYGPVRGFLGLEALSSLECGERDCAISALEQLRRVAPGDPAIAHNVYRGDRG